MSSKYPPVAIVGASALFPGSVTAGRFWQNILEGNDLFSDVPESHWLIDDYYDPDPATPDKTYARRGGFLPETDFSPMDFGVPPNIIPATDTAQLLALNIAQKVLEDAAGGDFSEMDRDHISVVLGVASATELVGHMSGRLQRPVWERALRNIGLEEEQIDAFSDEINNSYVEWQESTFPGLLGNVVAGRIANRLDLGGTNCVVDAACASSLAALEIGLNELYLGQSEMVITGGVDTLNDILMYMCFSRTTALSPSGDCRPFSDQADGTMLGEGIGMVALKLLDAAERDGDRIYAVVRGLGSSSDGRAKSIYAPVSNGQAKALRRCYEYAGYGPETVELVEAHGTGTKAGDAAEFGGLKMVFDDETERSDRQWCALGSVKSQIGHTKAAAGSAGLFKIAMALHHKAIPPTIKIDRPNPLLDLDDSPFYLNTDARPWIRGEDHPRRASISSFGFGGTNFHVALEEYTGPGNKAYKLRAHPSELFVWSAQTSEDLLETCRAIRGDLDVADEMFHFLARDSQESFDAKAPARLAIVASDIDDLNKKLTLVLDHISSTPSKPYSTPNGITYAVGQERGKIAFLFPGQGSQYVNMGNQLAISFDEARGVWDRATTLDLNADKALHDVAFPPTPFTEEERNAQRAELTATEWAQPAIGAMSLGMFEILRTLGVSPDCVGGHSYGEVTSLVAAGVLDETSCLKVSRKRGELMAEAAKADGTMTAVVSDIETLRAKLDEWGSDVVVANHNSPSQVVLSGATSDIEEVEGHLADAKMKFKRLKVATAFHSPIVSPSAEPFATFLKEIDFGTPSIPVYSNAEAAPYPTDADEMRARLSNQVAQPVRFVEQVQAMADSGVTTFIEVGPEAVLTNLVTRTLGEEITTIHTDRRGKHGVESLWMALGQMAVAGIEMDFAPLWADYRPIEDPRTVKKSPFQVQLNGANYGKPSPYREPTERSKQVAEKLNEQEVIEVEKVVEKIVEVPVASDASHQPGHAQSTSSTSHTPQAPDGSHTSNGRTQDGRWLDAFERMQQETAQAQTDFQQMMAESHDAFLEMARSSMQGLVTGNAHADQGHAPRSDAAQRTTSHTSPQVGYANGVTSHGTNGSTANGAAQDAAPWSTPSLTPPTTQPSPEATAQRPRARTGAASSSSSTHTQQAKAPQPSPQPTSTPDREPATATSESTEARQTQEIDLTEVMLDVVADKTGYPVEMLDLSMELEADLGIDSIKRVEILSAMQEEVPSLPEVETSKMAKLVTLQQIVAYLESLGVATVQQPVEQLQPQPATHTPPAHKDEHAPAPAQSGSSASSGHTAEDLTEVMLKVVADKTGYPAEMLDLSMELEADLGIDSIKRVEILSAMQEEVPSLPEVETSKMAELVTLKQIVEYLSSLGVSEVTLPAPSNTPAPEAQAGQAPAAQSNPLSDVDLVSVMLKVVADKTGYPAEMLDLSMELEADLGIDSIKRVEILSAMQEEVPGLPEVETSKMAELVTLQQIVDYMQSLIDEMSESSQPRAASPSTPQSTQSTQPAQTSSTDQTQPAASSTLKTELTPVMLKVVADKTGYPAEMLELDMELEADLGIDSIKRVEILSAMQEEVPGLPDVETSKMAELVTLQQIVDYMQGLFDSGSSPDGAGGAAQPAPAASTPSPAAAPAQDAGGLTVDTLIPVMLKVVADKTGYPAEMLELDMELEADLGIDSIKRVEILSAMQEEVPGLPDVEASKMAELVTLQQIVDFMAGAVEDDDAPVEAHVAATAVDTPAFDPATEEDTQEVEGEEFLSMPTQVVEQGLNEVSEVTPDVARYSVELVEAPARGLAMPRLMSARNIEIVSDRTGVAQALAKLIMTYGPQCFVVEDADSLTGEADAVIYLGGLREVDSPEQAIDVNREGFMVATRMAKRFTEKGGAFVTVQDTGGDFGTSGAGTRAYVGGLTGLVKTAHKEWDAASVRAIDVERGARTAGDVAQAIFEELNAGGAEVEVALSEDGTRRTFAARPSLPSMSGRRINKSSVLIVSGGARGVTAASIIELARQTRASFALLGRTQVADEEPAIFAGKQTEAELKRAAMEEAQASGESFTPMDINYRVKRIKADREVRATLAALRDAGSRARYASADVRDTATLRELFSSVRDEYGAITGLVHGAGVLADAFLKDKSPEQFDKVFGTKVEGLLAMLEALDPEEDDLEVLCTFSSVAARTGNAGQADYAMANEVLNRVALAEAAKRPDCLVKSLGWGPWEGGMVSPELKALFERRGVALIDLAEGARAFAAELLEEEEDAHTEVVLGGGVAAGGINSFVPEQGALTMEVHSSRSSNPYLGDHCIKDKVVLPVVLGMEWFARHVASSHPGAVVSRVRDLKVLKGILLSGWEGSGDRFIIESVRSEGADDLSLHDMAQTLRYKASVEVADEAPEPIEFAGLTADLEEAPYGGRGNLYSDATLFHGPAFHVIDSLDGISDEGAVATLRGLHEMQDWPADEEWVMDAALLDGCLQVALLWGLRVCGAQSLPMRINEVVCYSAPVAGTLRCELVGRTANAQRSVSDMRVTDADGNLIYDLRGVEMFVVPSEIPVGVE